MIVSSFQISSSLFLVRQEVNQELVSPPIANPVDHILIIDCSGSMAGDLPRIREQLKNKLPKILREEDTISIIWFSGRGEFGVLVESQQISNLIELKDMNFAIDRWLRPIGLTGFKEPLEEVSKLIERVKKKSKDRLFSLFFMSDGCDNCSRRSDILKALENSALQFASATYVEYGYYADRPLLTAMAEKSGGTLIFSEDFDSYAPVLESSLQRKLSGAPKIELDIAGDPFGEFVYAIRDNELVTFEIISGKVRVPEDFSEVYFLNPTLLGAEQRTVQSYSETEANGDVCSDILNPIAAIYAAVSLFSIRMEPDVVYPLLKALGDVALINQFSTCFGKQKYSDFMMAAKNAAVDPNVRFIEGWDPTRVPPDDAFTVLDLLDILANEDNNTLLLDHPAFRYGRISRGRVDAGERLNTDEVQELQMLTAQIAAERDVKKLKELQHQLANMTAKKVPGLIFKPKPATDGYSISHLVFNEDRPNISVLVKKLGSVDLSERLTNDTPKVPVEFETFIYRNYAIVRDGLVNIDVLPVKLSDATLGMLYKENLPAGTLSEDSEGVSLLNLRNLPVVNRKMVQSVSARELFITEYELCKARAAQKVYNSYQKEHFPRESVGFTAQYGEAASAWLKEQGLTDYSGFSPKTVQAESKDFYLGKELHVALKGFSSLPSLKDVKDRMVKGKLTPAASLMVPSIQAVEDFLVSPIYLTSPDPVQTFGTWLKAQQENAKNVVRRLLFEQAQIKFAIIVGQVWFSEFQSIEENSMELQLDGQKIIGTVTPKEVEIRI
jgi:hypothetical protein